MMAAWAPGGRTSQFGLESGRQHIEPLTSVIKLGQRSMPFCHARPKYQHLATTQFNPLLQTSADSPSPTVSQICNLTSPPFQFNFLVNKLPFNVGLVVCGENVPSAYLLAKVDLPTPRYSLPV
jgi:hypothetical protein